MPGMAQQFWGFTCFQLSKFNINCTELTFTWLKHLSIVHIFRLNNYNPAWFLYNRFLKMTKSILSGFFLLLFGSSVLGRDSVVEKNYVHVSKHLTWQEAQSHCRCLPLLAVLIITRCNAVKCSSISPLFIRGLTQFWAPNKTTTAFNLL